MANSELYNREFTIPEKIINYINGAIIKYPHSDGIKRAKFIVKNKRLTYQALKRIKNFFDTYNPEKDSKEKYILAGGDLMKNFIERELTSNRDAISRSKKNKEDITVDLNSGLKPQKTPKLHEGFGTHNRNVVAIIVNLENKVLLLKRASEVDWCPNKWAFVGGRVDMGETATEACRREVKEETGIELDEIINVFNLQRKNEEVENIEYIFACRYHGDSNIKINGEHVDYDWFSLDEIKKLDKVPNLNDYLSIAFKNYN